MNDIQFFVLLGTVLAGVIWQRVDYHQLSGRIDQLGNRLDQFAVRIDRISDDLKHFYHELGRHDEAIERLKNTGQK